MVVSSMDIITRDGAEEQAIGRPMREATKDGFDVTVIVVSYATCDLTLACLRTLLANAGDVDMEVIVFDNASPDGSADAVAETFPHVQLIRSSENLGFARANNLVAQRARGEYLLLLNPDTEVHDRAVERLLAFARANPDAGIWGGRTVFPDGSLNPSSCWDRITLRSQLFKSLGLGAVFGNSSFFNPEALPGWKRDSIRKVDIVVGCFFLISRSLWMRLEGFQEKYFMYGEEADMCLRAQKLGYQPMITPDATIMHIAGAASATRADKVVRVAQARAQLMRDHFPRWKVPVGIALLWLWSATRLVGSACLAAVPGARHRARLRLWREVWSLRRQWLAGYASTA